MQSGQKSHYIDSEYKGGFYLNAGAGYKINIFKSNAIIFSAAFSMKKVVEKTDVFCDFAPCPETGYKTYNYTFRRLSLKAGWTMW